MWITNAAMSPIRSAHSKKVRGNARLADVAEPLGVVVDVLLAEVHLEVADHVGEHEARAT